MYDVKSVRCETSKVTESKGDNEGSLTRKLCLVESQNRLWTPRASYGDFLLSAKLFHVILDMET